MAKSDQELDALCAAIAAVAKTARDAGLSSVNVASLGISMTIAPLQAPVAPVRPQPGPAARMADFHATQVNRAQQRHDVLFAASRVKPRFEPPAPPPSVVPRAVRAKEEAAARGEASSSGR